MQELLKKTNEKMDKSFENLLHSFTRIRTGRASASVLDDIKINYYGQLSPIKQLCNITIPEPRMIIIQPWDKTTLADIEKAILAANMGITPDNDGNVIRLPFQALTEDKRRDIAKQIKKLGEDAKVAMRNIRREANELAKKMQKDGDITEDEEKKVLTDIQEKTDDWIKKIDEAIKNKEKEVMEI